MFPFLSKHKGMVRLIILIVAAFVAVTILPPWIETLLSAFDRPLRRRVTLAFLDAFPILYAIALISSAGGGALLLFARLRARARGVRRSSPIQAKLLLLCASVLVSLAALEAGAALWRKWLHESPRLAGVGPAEKEPAKEESAVPLTGTAPTLRGQLPTRDGNAIASAPLRIVVIGESSGRGEPYHPMLSVGQIAVWRLEKVFPGRRIEVEMWAKGGAILEGMHNKLTDLTYRPDALLLYLGHNEFQGRFSWTRDVDYYLDQDRALVAPVPEVVERSPLLRFSPLCQLITETREGQRLDTVPTRNVTRQLVDVPCCTAAEAAVILADFKRRLEEIASYCEKIGTLPIFVIPPSCDGDYDPSRSVLAAETPESERVAFARQVVCARALEETDRAEAIRINRALLESHPEFAETHYRLARLLEQSGSWDEARAHYIQARERDGMPIRCPEAFRQAFRDLAAKHPAVLLVDGPKVLEARSLHGILGGQFFHDAQHPNLRGYAALTEDLLAQLGARRAFGWPRGAPVPAVVPEACAIHFKIDTEYWMVICRREVGFFQGSAYIRYDPTFRNERAVAYLRARKAMGEGRDPSEADIPGWSMAPKPSGARRIPRGERDGRHWSMNDGQRTATSGRWSVAGW
jgi:tetratricopeptide (TPR) repeat protein